MTLSMTHPLQLDLTFRGSRDYLQGADIYEGMLKAGQDQIPTGPIHIQYHTLLHKQPDLILSQEPVTHWRKEPAYRGEVRFGKAEGYLYAVLLESDRPVDVRVPCNESEVVKTAVVDVPARTATLPFPSVGTPMEKVVFLNKQLHFKVLPDIKEKWLFVKLELTEALPPTGEKEMKLILKQNLGNRFTRTEIVIDDKSFGYITFSTAK